MVHWNLNTSNVDIKLRGRRYTTRGKLYLNTSNVDIKRSRITLCIASVLNLNTSNVDIKLLKSVYS